MTINAYATTNDDAPAGNTTSLDEAALDQAFADLYSHDIPALVAEVRHGDDVWSSAEGNRTLDGDTPAEVTDRFRAASVSKSMVATIALQLQTEDYFDLDDTVEEHMPGLLPYEEDITLRHLLQHMSGLADDYLGGHIHSGVYRDADWTTLEESKMRVAYPPEHVELGTQAPLGFEPGTDFKYNNTGYSIVGLVIEEVTGNTLAEELEQRIFEPAEMSSSYLPDLDSFTLEGDSLGSYFETGDTDQPYVDTTEMSASQSWAAGGVISTVSDLNDFYRAQSDGTLLTAAEYDEATDLYLTEGSRHGYGLGMSAVDIGCDALDDGIAIGHYGDGTGHQTRSLHSFDGELQVTIAWNADDRLNTNADRWWASIDLLTVGLCGDSVDASEMEELVDQLTQIETSDRSPDPVG